MSIHGVLFYGKRKLKFLREDKMDSAMIIPYLCVVRVYGKNVRYLTLNPEQK